MNALEITRIVQAEIARGERFTNLHGISSETISTFLTVPHEVTVDPDDLESPPRPMWVVLQERPRGADPGYGIAFDPSNGTWCVVERKPDGDLVCVISAQTLAGALDGM